MIDLALSEGEYFDTFIKLDWVQEGRWFPAIEAIGLLSRNHNRHFATIRDHSRIADGITEQEAPVVAVLYDVVQHNPEILPQMLNFDTVSVEERTVLLPLSGEARISIVRTDRGLPGTMDLLEEGVIFVEEWIGAPLLRRNLVFFFGDAAAAGQGHNSWLAVVSPAEYEDPGRDQDISAQHYVHETAHWYFRQSEPWVNEGAADFLAAQWYASRTGWPAAPIGDLCADYLDIATLISEGIREPSQPGFWCYYSLGERIFLDFHRAMGDEAFREAFRALYRLWPKDDPDDDCESTYLWLCHVETVFQEAAGEAVYEQVIGCWHTYLGEAVCLTPAAVPVGPLSGRIQHRPGNDQAEYSPSLPVAVDFMLTTVFENPEPWSEWIYGIQVESEQGQHHINISSHQRWQVNYWNHRVGRGGKSTRKDALSIDRTEGAENHFRLIRVGESGYLYINDVFVGDVPFDLGDTGAATRVRLFVLEEGQGQADPDSLTVFRDLWLQPWSPDLWRLPSE